MTEVVRGKNIIYSLVPMKSYDISFLNNVKRHEIVGYVLMKQYCGTYIFYSIEDKYTSPIVNHWTASIVKNYDTETCWLLIKQHPCKISSIMTTMYNRQLCHVENFDILKSDSKNCLVAVVTEMDLD